MTTASSACASATALEYTKKKKMMMMMAQGTTAILDHSNRSTLTPPRPLHMMLQAFIRANEKHGRQNIVSITKDIEGKDEAEVRRYAKVFWARGHELAEWDKHIVKIEEGEKKIERQHDINRALQVRQTTRHQAKASMPKPANTS